MSGEIDRGTDRGKHELPGKHKWIFPKETGGEGQDTAREDSKKESEACVGICHCFVCWRRGGQKVICSIFMPTQERGSSLEPAQA